MNASLRVIARPPLSRLKSKRALPDRQNRGRPNRALDQRLNTRVFNALGVAEPRDDSWHRGSGLRQASGGEPGAALLRRLRVWHAPRAQRTKTRRSSRGKLAQLIAGRDRHLDLAQDLNDRRMRNAAAGLRHLLTGISILDGNSRNGPAVIPALFLCPLANAASWGIFTW